MKRALEVNRRREPTRGGESATERVLPKGDVKRRLMIAHASLPITTGHRDFIKVGREGGEVLPWRVHG
jgi:hypothetical protein